MVLNRSDNSIGFSRGGTNRSGTLRRTGRLAGDASAETRLGNEWNTGSDQNEEGKPGRVLCDKLGKVTGVLGALMAGVAGLSTSRKASSPDSEEDDHVPSRKTSARRSFSGPNTGLLITRKSAGGNGPTRDFQAESVARELGPLGLMAKSGDLGTLSLSRGLSLLLEEASVAFWHDGEVMADSERHRGLVLRRRLTRRWVGPILRRWRLRLYQASKVTSKTKE